MGLETDGLYPDRVCGDVTGDTIVLSAIGFTIDSRVVVNGQEWDTIMFSDFELWATVPPGFEPGTYAVTVDNGSGCMNYAPSDLVYEETCP